MQILSILHFSFSSEVQKTWEGVGECTNSEFKKPDESIWAEESVELVSP